MTKVLVAYATKYGSTAEIAQAVGATIKAEGLAVDVRPARDLSSLEGYDAVVLGSGLYVGGWHEDAVWFVRKFDQQLKARPVWLFSSGPTGGSAEALAQVEKAKESPTAFPMTKSVEKYANRIGARGHATFPGMVGDNFKGFWAKWIPKGDWRDFDAIADWSRSVAVAIEGVPLAV